MSKVAKIFVEKEKEKKLLGKYHLVLGLEIHMHVKTDRKMFCTCATKGVYDAQPNTHICPVCLGLPGALPVPNKEAVEKTQKLGLALNCTVNNHARFDRKHYFYPDLAKGYQISQYKEPFCSEGYLRLTSGSRVEIERIHLEEDTAKSFHKGAKTLIDFNKSGIALIEMVTKPTIYSVEDAVEYCKQVQEIVRFLGISDANMEKGQLRIEPNISLRTEDMVKRDELADYKVEVKNINSFKFMEKAVKAEILRQKKLLDAGETPLQENRGYDEASGKTVLQRSKEDAHDYRYFPEPDIPPMEFDATYISALQSSLSDLPSKCKQNLVEKFGLAIQDVEVLFSENLVDLLEKVVGLGVNSKKAVNLLVNRLEYRKMSPEDFVKSVENVQDRISDVSDLEKVVDSVLEKHASVVAQIRAGKDSAREFLVGQVMKETRGTADPAVVRQIFSEKL